MIAHDRAARSFLQCRADRSDRWIEVDCARGACRRRSEKRSPAGSLIGARAFRGAYVSLA